MITEAILIAAATSADIFAAVLGLRTAGIKLPPYSAAAAAASGAAVLWISAYASSLINSVVPISGAVYISKAILIFMGLYTIFGGLSKSRSRTKKHGGLISSCMEVMNDPASADSDKSESISITEGIAMGLALSADSVFTGVSAGIAGISPLLILIFSLIFGSLACFLGVLAGNLLNSRLKRSFPAWIIGGAILIIIALTLNANPI